MDLSRVKLIANALRNKLVLEKNILALDKDLHIWTNNRDLWVTFVNDNFRAETRIPADICLVGSFEDFHKEVVKYAYMKITYHLTEKTKGCTDCVPLFSQI